MTFAALWQEVQDANPELAAVAAESVMAAGNEVQAALRPNPQLQIMSDYLGAPAREETVAVAQTIELGGKRAARMALAGRLRDLAGGLIAQKRAVLRATLRQAFFELLAAQARVDLAAETLALTRQDVDSVRQQIEAGRLPAVAATRTDIELTNAVLDTARARASLARNQRHLAALLGDRARSVTVAGSLADLHVLPPLSVLEDALPSAPALTTASLETARRAAQTDVEATHRYGDLTLTVGLRYLSEVHEPAAVLSVSVPLPFSDRNQGNLARAQGAAEQAAALERAMEIEVARDLDDAYQRYDTAVQATMRIADTIVPAAEHTLAVTIRGFKLGKFGLIELIDARRTLLAARTQLIDARLEAQSAISDVSRVLGDERLADAAETKQP
ncbi:MAG: TolC family protein [Gammaproteobacteria bacterium]|nr:TolC family protein [Gammaproteobacteria bacterium]